MMSKLKVKKMINKKIDLKKLSFHCHEISHLLKLLSHPQRLLILSHLQNGEKTVTELENNCSISQSQLSQFLSRMRAEGLVFSKTMGTYHFYSIKDDRIKALILQLEQLFCKNSEH